MRQITEAGLHQAVCTMDIKDFDYKFPVESIAIYPPSTRGTTKLFVINTSKGTIEVTTYNRLLDYLSQQDLLLRNISQVINSRLKIILPDSGRTAEVFVLSIHDAIESQMKIEVPVLIKGHKKKLLNRIISLSENWNLVVTEKEADIFVGTFSIDEKLPTSSIKEEFIVFLHNHGEVPLPPYFHREQEESDKQRYRTEFGSIHGSVAAPTASLNLKKSAIDELISKGIIVCDVVLHVGMGTFTPLKEKNIVEDSLHTEYYSIPKKTVDHIVLVKSTTRKVIAIGTTTLRAIESVSPEMLSRHERIDSHTNIFIHDPYTFKYVDSLLTNFHLPKSSLIMLVDAFLKAKDSKISWKEIYTYAIEHDAKLFSYGDSMLIL